MDVKFKELCLPSAPLGERYLRRQTTPATWAKTASARRLSCCPCRCSGRPSSSLSPSRRCWWWRRCERTQTREAVRRQTSDCGSRKHTHWFARRLPVDGCVADARDGGKDPRPVDLLLRLLAVGRTLDYELREVDLSCSDITFDGWDDCRGEGRHQKEFEDDLIAFTRGSTSDKEFWTVYQFVKFWESCHSYCSEKKKSYG